MSKPLPETASQTAGPYLHIGCMPNAAGIAGVFPQDLGAQMLTDAIPGPRIEISGKIFDGAGAPLRDAMIELWQADASGRYGSPGFTGWARKATDVETGIWRLKTIRPGTVRIGQDTVMAPHITLWIVARGINTGLHTRMYFPEDARVHTSDPALAQVSPADRVRTLIAWADGLGSYHFDIHLQGPDETVFFDV
ncbi:protocatechuate 3,4-dioxygenase subunit alpha [uncultured Roseobacter sp.]|uniref:protocatechuate 3,4-dioxygenase subunit alpha n=1 Tax=uncultured Roseobacter sp. TaxID=114847 RepID=UPI00261A313C|nr:protocatechuate 3,4-dioxygenase subunit alpha [uncultured Roseobacter sp.]